MDSDHIVDASLLTEGGGPPDVDWKQKFIELLTRGADGVVSDEDVEFILSLLTGSSDDPKAWLQGLVDQIGPDNMKKLLGLYLIFG